MATKATVDEVIGQLMETYDVPGVSVGLTVEGQRYFFNYGVAARDGNQPVTSDTLFEIGSLSKTFTATLVSYAQGLGKLDLSDHPSRYLPSLAGTAIDRANLLQLGTYTAGGLPLQFPDAVSDDTGIVSFFRQWTPSAAPGQERQYSNPSIGLLGYAAAVALKGDFARLLEDDVFRPLGLRHTYIHVPPAESHRYAWGYDKANRPTRVAPGAFGDEAYGVKTTVVDMIAFAEANIHPATLDAPLRRAVEGTHVGYFRIGPIVQGLGWEQFSYPTSLDELLAGNSSEMSMRSNPATRLDPPAAPSKPTLFDKTGSTNGFAAYVAFVPARGIGVVLLANKNVPIPARIAAAHKLLTALTELRT